MAENFYSMRVNNQIDILGGPSCGTQYNFKDACVDCGTGALPVGPRIIKNGCDLPAKQTITSLLDNTVLIQNNCALCHYLQDIRCAAPVVDKKNTVLPFIELRAQETLPPFLQQTEGYERSGSKRACTTCGRDGFFNVLEKEVQLVYSIKTFHNLKRLHVLQTWEGLGFSRLREKMSDSIFSSPIYVVRGEIKMMIEEKHCDEVVFEKVVFV